MSRLLAFSALATATLAISFALCTESLQAAPLCPLGNATLHGTYIVSGTGTVGGVPIAAVGEITWDGEGNSVATYTARLNGVIHKGVTVTGTYIVHPDCTGSHEESDGSHYDFVVVPDGNRTTWISTDTGAVVSGTTVRLKPVEDEAAQVHASNKPALPASRHLVAVQPANFRSKKLSL
jgi:hypothetical protein